MDAGAVDAFLPSIDLPFSYEFVDGGVEINTDAGPVFPSIGPWGARKVKTSSGVVWTSLSGTIEAEKGAVWIAPGAGAGPADFAWTTAAALAPEPLFVEVEFPPGAVTGGAAANVTSSPENSDVLIVCWEKVLLFIVELFDCELDVESPPELIVWLRMPVSAEVSLVDAVVRPEVDGAIGVGVTAAPPT